MGKLSYTNEQGYSTVAYNKESESVKRLQSFSQLFNSILMKFAVLQ